MPPALGSGREIETTLVILSDEPEAIVRRIAEKTKIGGYRLTGAATKLLADTYFDTPTSFLFDHQLNLRIRTENQKRWITVKTFPGNDLPGPVVRGEMEVPWSPEAVDKVISKLKIPTQALVEAGTLTVTDPIRLLEAKGLVQIQHRETRREIRNVTISPEGSHVLAELDIDSVVYDLDDQKIRLFEVEVESKSEKGHRVVERVTKSLKKEYGHVLASWCHGKLATGMGILRLLRSGELRSLIDNEWRLLPAAYDRINEIVWCDHLTGE